MKRIALLTLSSLCLFTLASFADLTLNLEATSGKTSGAVPMTMKISSNAFRVDSGENSVVFTTADKRMMVLIPQTKQFMYMAIPKGENVISAAAGKAPELVRTGRKQNINGFDCSEIVLRYDSKRACDLWLSKEGPKVGTLLKNMSTFFDEQQSAKMGMDWLTFFGQNPEFSTFPIQTINHAPDGSEESRMTLKTFNESGIPASEFSPPAGYTEQKMPAIPGFTNPSAQGGTQGLDPEMIKKMQEEMGGKELTPEQLEQLKKLSDQMGR